MVPLFKSANDERRRTSRIRSTEVTDGAVFTLVGWHMKRGTIVVLLVIGFQSTRSPCLSLRLPIVSYRAGRRLNSEKKWVRGAGFKFKFMGIPEGGVRKILCGKNTESGWGRSGLYRYVLAVPSVVYCATILCGAVRSVRVRGQSKTLSVTCLVTTIPPKLFLVNRHRAISNRPGPANKN